MRLLVATHLVFCASCRSRLARIEAIGGAFLQDVALPNEVAPPDIEAALARLEERTPPKRSAAREAAGLPEPIRRALWPQAANLPWRELLPGLWDIPLPCDTGEDVRLLKGRPGVEIYAHAHAGDEATIVLFGHLRDGERTFGPGEVSLCGPEDNHAPHVVGATTCYCLLVLNAPLRFTDPRGPIPNLH